MKVSYSQYNASPDAFSVDPGDRYRPFKIRKRRQHNDWCAPEHFKTSKHMERAYRHDVKGRLMKELGKEIILEQRPTIMIPERKPIFLGLDQNAS